MSSGQASPEDLEIEDGSFYQLGTWKYEQKKRRNPPRWWGISSGKVKDLQLNAQGFEIVFDESFVVRVTLVFFFSLSAVQNDIQRNLVGLFDNRSLARNHFSCMKRDDSGDVRQQFLGSREKFVGRIALFGVSPENNNMRKHTPNPAIFARKRQEK